MSQTIGNYSVFYYTQNNPFGKTKKGFADAIAALQWIKPLLQRGLIQWYEISNK